MSADWHRLIERIHAAPLQGVIVVTGGGASAIADLLAVPGGSRTVLEATVPYSAAALTDWLGRRPEHFCTEETALAMAAVAYRRAETLNAETLNTGSAANSRHAVPKSAGDALRGVPQTSLAAEPANQSIAASDPLSTLLGVACTASLVSDRPKKGDHRCHIATQSLRETASFTLVLEKGARGRADEEALVGHLIVLALARAAGIAELPALDLRPGEQTVEHRAIADPLLVDLLAGRRSVVWSLPGGTLTEKPVTRPSNAQSAIRDRQSAIPNPHGLLSGAFNPLHFGHRELRDVAEEILGGPVYYEMSIKNVDKPPLDYLTIDRRRAQFDGQPLALTAAPTFAEKAAVLPGIAFIVGVDTAERIVEPRYYGGSEESLRDALESIRRQSCRFLVAGRKMDDWFRTLADIAIPAEYAELFVEIPAGAFRADVSSTELRAKGP